MGELDRVAHSAPTITEGESMKKRGFVVLTIAAFLLITGSPPAIAQQPTDEQVPEEGQAAEASTHTFNVMGSVVERDVPAKKREESIYEVPVAISAFVGEELQKQGITDLTDIGKFVPNLNVTGFSAGHTSSTNAFIRGIGLQDHLITTDPGVSVNIDSNKK